MDKNYTISLMADKLEVTRIVESYQNSIENEGQILERSESVIADKASDKFEVEKKVVLRSDLCPTCKNPINKLDKNCEWCDSPL
jgi:uncharacterized protein with PIN domain